MKTGKILANGTRVVKTRLFEFVPVSMLDRQYRKLAEAYETKWGVSIPHHERRRMIGAKKAGDDTLYGVCAYADFPEHSERDVLDIFLVPGRLGKVAGYELLNCVMNTTPSGWRFCGTIIFSNHAMRKAAELAGLRPFAVAYERRMP